MRTLHLVSHTHWDREWYLPFQEFRLKLVHLVDGLLNLLAADAEFQYFMLDGQTIVLDDYLVMRPEREADLRREVLAGRLLIGPWHILPDEYLVSPEATIRNLLQGDRTARRFGPKMPVGYVPDPFGHIGQMPQILRGFGIDAACVQRGLSDEPCEFWWEAPDGSRVLMAYLRDGYGNAAGLPTNQAQQFVSEVCRLRDSLAPHAASTHLLLMHGTDHMEPPPGTAAAIAQAAGQLGGDQIIHSTLPGYLSAMRSSLDLAELPAIRGELRSPKRHPLLPNVLSARMWIKQHNHACETLLERWVEPFCTVAELIVSQRSPRPSGHLAQPWAVIRQAWRMLMENHPHDSICGCSVDQVYEEMRTRFDQVEQVGEGLTRQALAALTAAVTTRPMVESAAYAIVVFNPTSGPRRDVVTATFELPGDLGAFDVVDETGSIIPVQTMGLGSSELINLTLGSAEFRNAFNMVSEGRVAGMALCDIHLRRDGRQMSIEVVLSERGEVNLEAWRRGVAEIENALGDETLTTYAVRARSADSTLALFSAPAVPGHGYRTFWVRRRPEESKSPQRLSPLARALLPLAGRLAQSRWGQRLLSRLRPDPARRPPFRIENEYLVVEATRDGTLNVNDKRTGAEYRGLNLFADSGDCGDEYNFAPPASDWVTTARLQDIRVTRGPVRQTLELRLGLTTPAGLTEDRKSRSAEMTNLQIESRISLCQGVPRVEVETTVDNRARDHRLRVHFPAPFAAAHADHDGHFEVVRRQIGVPAFDPTWVEQPRPELPQRAFTGISNGSIGLLIANRGLPEVEVRQRTDGKAEIVLTLLRCVGWLSRDDFSTRKGHAGPFVPVPGAQMPGSWTFEYAIIPHAGGCESAYEQAYAFQAPLRAVSTALHDGTLPPQSSFVLVQPAAFTITAIKTAEDEQGWLVRGYNLTDVEITVTLTPRRLFEKADLVNLAEEALSELTPLADGSISFVAHGHEIKSVLFHDA